MGELGQLRVELQLEWDVSDYESYHISIYTRANINHWHPIYLSCYEQPRIDFYKYYIIPFICLLREFTSIQLLYHKAMQFHDTVSCAESPEPPFLHLPRLSLLKT